MGNKFVNYARQRREAKKGRAKETSSGPSVIVVAQVVSEPVVLEVKSPEMVTKPQQAPTPVAVDTLSRDYSAIIKEANRKLDNISTARFKLGP